MQNDFFKDTTPPADPQITLEEAIQAKPTGRPETLPGLRHFTGTENYFKVMMGYKLTDGVKHVCETAGAYWLTDVIISHAMAHKNQDMLACTLKVFDATNSANFTMTDGDDNVLAAQEIEYTDFPAQSITLWVVDGVIMLPSEY